MARRGVILVRVVTALFYNMAENQKNFPQATAELPITGWSSWPLLLHYRH